jgi:hemerythrin-like domain-containing protein
MGLKEFNKNDHLNRFVEKDSLDEGLTPMNPPDPYSVQNVEQVPFDKMHPLLQSLIEDHKITLSVLKDFEDALIQWKNNGWIFNEETNKKLNRFFVYYDELITKHNSTEEKILFPILSKKLTEAGEHSKGEKQFTSIELMEDEHIKIAQAVAIVINFLGLGSRLTDKKSKETTFELAFSQGMAIVETFRLHIFREENILFPLTMNLFTKDDFEKINRTS